MKYTLKLVTEQHYIEGDKLYLFLEMGEGEHKKSMPLVIDENPNNILAVADCMDGLKFRLEKLGNEVEIQNIFRDDPNFDTEEQAQDYYLSKK